MGGSDKLVWNQVDVEKAEGSLLHGLKDVLQLKKGLSSALQKILRSSINTNSDHISLAVRYLVYQQRIPV